MGDDATAVLLLRHAESTWNAEQRWQGRADPPLSPKGERQARAAAAALPTRATVWSSDLARARCTAEQLASPGEVRLDARLRERDVGDWTGLTRADIDVRYPGWLTDGRRPHGWETDVAVRARVWSVVHAAAEEHSPGDAAVVVSHGGVIRALCTGLGAPAWPIGNVAGVWLHRAHEGFVLGSRLTLLDDGWASRTPVVPVE